MAQIRNLIKFKWNLFTYLCFNHKNGGLGIVCVNWGCEKWRISINSFAKIVVNFCRLKG